MNGDRTLAVGTLGAMLALGALVACGGGGGSGGGSGPMPGGGSTSPPVSTHEVIFIALPTSAMGYESSAFGQIGGYTQDAASQVLGFAPGSKVMLENAQVTGSGSPPHTLGDTGAQSFISNPPLSMTPQGGSTLSAGFQSGTINPGHSIGPITLAAGTYYIGCAYHYAQYGMRDVLVVASGAAPGPQATPPAGQTSPPMGGGGGYGY